jgi:hypothetical protein
MEQKDNWIITYLTVYLSTFKICPFLLYLADG